MKIEVKQSVSIEAQQNILCPTIKRRSLRGFEVTEIKETQNKGINTTNNVKAIRLSASPQFLAVINSSQFSNVRTRGPHDSGEGGIPGTKQPTTTVGDHNALKAKTSWTTAGVLCAANKDLGKCS